MPKFNSVFDYPDVDKLYDNIIKELPYEQTYEQDDTELEICEYIDGFVSNEIKTTRDIVMDYGILRAIQDYKTYFGDINFDDMKCDHDFYARLAYNVIYDEIYEKVATHVENKVLELKENILAEKLNMDLAKLIISKANEL